jgi:hypothetical protein
MVATEAWPPNAQRATELLGPRGVEVVETAAAAPLPFELVKVTFAGTARSRFSDKIIVRRSLNVKNLQHQPIGKVHSITNESGALTVVFDLTRMPPTPAESFFSA